jgi:hypothetical protein
VRIERLPQENARTQGAARRLWYRQRNPEHLRAVAELLDATLARRGADAPGAAVVFGAGACTEIPLERLARACRRVTLVDLDVPGMERARQELPPGLRERVEPLGADVSGGVSRALAERLREQPWKDLAALSERAVLDAAAGCIERCPVPDPPPLAGVAERSCGLVVSALVLTQLFSLPLLDVLDTLSAAAPQMVGLQEANPRYHAAARAFRRRVALAHLNLLASLVAPGGAALLLTDVTGYLLAPDQGTHAGEAREELPLLPPDLVDLPAELAVRFELLMLPRRWEWLATAPERTQPGRAYAVIGAVLRPRPRSSIVA